MVVVRILDHIKHCYSNSDGDVIQKLIRDQLKDGNSVSVSFEGVDSVSSSFVNSAFIELLATFSFDLIRQKLGFINSTKSINDVIKKRFSFEVNERKNLLNV